MKFFGLSLIVFFVFGVNLQAQQKLILGSRVERKITVADKKIAKGDAIVGKKEKYTRQIEAIDAQGKARSGKVKRLQAKSNKIVVSSASFYKDGYGKKYNTYKKVVNSAVNEGTLGDDAASLMNNAKEEYKSGRKLRRKSGNLSDVSRAATMLLDANEVEANAVETLIKATSKYRQIEIETVSPEDVVQESLMDSTNIVAVPALTSELALAMDSTVTAQKDVISHPNAILYVDSTLVTSLTQDSLVTLEDGIIANITVEPLLEDAVVIAPETKEAVQVYFSVQFLAEKSAVSKDRLMQLYDGPFEVHEHKAEGWYRYSFGEFPSVVEASEMKTRSGVQGFVVAYLNDKRITIKEAKELLKQ